MAKTAKRLDEGWTLPNDWRLWALQLGLSQELIAWEADKFADYWLSASGQNARKHSWERTWRNWCRRVIEQQGRGSVPSKPWQLTDDELLEACQARGISTRGRSRKQLMDAVSAKQMFHVKQ